MGTFSEGLLSTASPVLISGDLLAAVVKGRRAIKAGVEATQQVIKSGDNVSEAGRILRGTNNLKEFNKDAIPTYDPQVRARGVEDPKSHNFPYSFDKGILSTPPIPNETDDIY